MNCSLEPVTSFQSNIWANATVEAVQENMNLYVARMELLTIQSACWNLQIVIGISLNLDWAWSMFNMKAWVQKLSILYGWNINLSAILIHQFWTIHRWMLRFINQTWVQDTDQAKNYRINAIFSVKLTAHLLNFLV